MMLTKGRRYVAAVTGIRSGERVYREVEFVASRDQEVEPFIRDRETTPDQDRVFRSLAPFGSVPMLVVTGTIKGFPDAR